MAYYGWLWAPLGWHSITLWPIQLLALHLINLCKRSHFHSVLTYLRLLAIECNRHIFLLLVGGWTRKRYCVPLYYLAQPGSSNHQKIHRPQRCPSFLPRARDWCSSERGPPAGKEVECILMNIPKFIQTRHSLTETDFWWLLNKVPSQHAHVHTRWLGKIICTVPEKNTLLQGQQSWPKCVALLFCNDAFLVTSMTRLSWDWDKHPLWQ